MGVRTTERERSVCLSPTRGLGWPGAGAQGFGEPTAGAERSLGLPWRLLFAKGLDLVQVTKSHSEKTQKTAEVLERSPKLCS